MNMFSEDNKHTKKRNLHSTYRLVVFLLSFIISIGNIKAQEYKFFIDEYNITHGISDDHIIDITIDSKKNIWFAHRKGIVKYDGIEFVEIPTLAFDKRIKQIQFDENDMLYILFVQSSRPNESNYDILKFYNPNTEQIDLSYYEKLGFDDKLLKTKSDESNKISHISKDYKNEIILTLINHDTYHVKNKHYRSNKGFQHLSIPYQISPTLSRIPYRDMQINMHRYIENKSPNIAVEFYEDKKVKYTIKKKPTTHMFRLEDERNELIIGNLKSNIFVRDLPQEIYFYNLSNIVSINKETNEKTNITKFFHSEFEGKYIYDLEVDNETLWVATTNGIFRVSKAQHRFPSFITGDQTSIRDFELISSDSILVATETGLFLYNPISKSINKLFSELQIYSITPLKGGAYNLGSFSKNLFFWERDKPKEFIQVNKNSLPPKFPLNGLIDSDGNSWVSSDQTIKKIDPATMELMDLDFKPIDSYITALYETKDKKLLCLTFNGLYIVDKEQKRILPYRSIQNINVSAIQEDKKEANILWICTKGDGLLKYNLTTNQCDTLTKKHGLLNNNVHSIYEDDNNKLWLSTDYGISVIDKTTSEIINLSKKNGLHENEMNRHSHLKLDDGSILYGSINGFIHFDPNSLNLTSSHKNVDLKYLEFLDSKRNQIKKLSPQSKSDIKIKEFYKNPTLVFVPSDNNYSNQLRYLAIGRNLGWEYTTDNKINLSFLDGGETNLLISKKVSFNEWSDPILVTVTKESPFYKSWWFYLALAIIILIITLYWINYNRLKTASINRKIKKQVAVQTQELSIKNSELSDAQTLNDQIFSIIGHDLRSPILSLLNISTSLKYLLQKKDHKNAIKLGNTVELNAVNLLSTIDRLLEWSNSYKSKKQIKKPVLIDKYLTSIVNEFSQLINEKELTISLEFKGNLYIHIFSDTLGVIIRNLIQNAIKYSFTKGKINLSYYFDKSINKHKLLVTDQGIGINDSLMEQIKNSTEIRSSIGTKGELGIGLGLKLCVILLNSIDGDILAFQNTPNGSIFEITF